MPDTPETGIADLEELVARMPEADRAAFHRIFHVSTVTGHIRPPESMRPWLERQFGSVEAALSQRIVKVTNTVTLQGALFNPLRSSRPLPQREADLESALAQDTGDPLDTPYESTPEDVFGRIRGRFSVTASNVAKADAFHGLVVYDERHPLRWHRDQIADYLETGLQWARAAHRYDPSARYYLFIWNCLWRAGASLLHGHAQVLLGRDMHYAAVEALRRAASAYRERHGTGYFDDLYRAHAAAGCAFEREGVRVLANLAPIKEREVLLVAPRLDGALASRVYEVLACFRDRLGVRAFNVAVYHPPLGEPAPGWEDFPVVVRLVDRGDPASRTADIGAMELYASSVISTDPFDVVRCLRKGSR